MIFFVIALILSGSISTLAQVEHEFIFTYGCFDSGNTEAVGIIDGDEFGYANFKNSKLETMLPVLLQNQQSQLLFNEYANPSRAWCMNWMRFGQSGVPTVPQVKDAPDTTIYTKDEIELGMNNALICFVNNFFPPSIKVNWTKNDMDVTEGASLSRYHPNTDGTYYLFSILNFTPQEGDIYGCTVVHTALEEPMTRFWDPDVSESSAGPSIFCGVGLTLGLLGLATGTFLLIKGNIQL